MGVMGILTLIHSRQGLRKGRKPEGGQGRGWSVRRVGGGEGRGGGCHRSEVVRGTCWGYWRIVGKLKGVGKLIMGSFDTGLVSQLRDRVGAGEGAVKVIYFIRGNVVCINLLVWWGIGGRGP